MTRLIRSLTCHAKGTLALFHCSMYGNYTVLIVVALLVCLAHAYPQEPRHRRQFDGNNFVDDVSQQQRRWMQRRQQQQQQPPGAELVFSTNNQIPSSSTPLASGSNNNGQVVYVNNQPVTVTMAPFVERTTPTPQFVRCFNSCPTTPEYNPICASNRELYFNEQKFNCAQRCGADIQIVRRGSCEGLFPMMRG